MSNDPKPNKDSVFTEYDLKVHRIGRWTMLLATLASFLPIAISVLFFGAEIDLKAVGMAFTGVFMMFGINGFIEPFAFAPILGAGATYIAFTTGNVSQTKVPCVVSSQKIMGVEMGTPEGDVVATLATGVCSLVTTLEVAIGMIFVNVIYGFLQSPLVKPGFDNILPAVLGAVSVLFISKMPKVGFVPYALYGVFLFIMGKSFDERSYGIYCMLVLIVITVGFAYFMRKRSAEKAKSQ
ncbi:MAG: hypothetical protein LBT59_23055 [Clostridiales bacterium]|jgi:hypothetical protein|nr:hypothetical protein [Clostridiales bacterium]